MNYCAGRSISRYIANELQFNKQIKHLIVFCLVISVLGTGIAGASPVVIISQQHHVYGHYTTSLPGEPNGSYDITNWSPANGAVSYDSGINASSSAELFMVSAKSSALSYDSNGKRIFGSAAAAADGCWTFKPDIDCYQFDLRINAYDLWAGDRLEVQLEDITSGEQLYYFSGQPGHIPNWTEPFSQTFSVNPDHEYYMHAFISSTAGTDGPWSGSIAIFVPEPATVLIFGIGTALMFRKRK